MKTFDYIATRAALIAFSFGFGMLIQSFWRLTYNWSETWRIMHTMKRIEAEKLRHKQKLGF